MQSRQEKPEDNIAEALAVQSIVRHWAYILYIMYIANILKRLPMYRAFGIGCSPPVLYILFGPCSSCLSIELCICRLDTGLVLKYNLCFRFMCALQFLDEMY